MKDINTTSYYTSFLRFRQTETLLYENHISRLPIKQTQEPTLVFLLNISCLFDGLSMSTILIMASAFSEIFHLGLVLNFANSVLFHCWHGPHQLAVKNKTCFMLLALALSSSRRNHSRGLL